MKKPLVFLLFALTMSSILSQVSYVDEAMPTGRVTLRADNGLYLSRCFKCGSASYPDSVAIFKNNPSDV